MTVHIRETPYETSSGSTYPVRADEARGHLMIIASGGTGDLAPSFGDEPISGNPDYSLVLYDPSPAPGTATASDRVRTRLLALVTDSTVYQLVGVAGSTVWSDGTTVDVQPAFALGNTLFYDTSNCNGSGRWIRGVNGEEECTNSVGMLYHELAHAFHDHGLGTIADEEAEAIEDENDLREALGLVLRDPARIEGGCGCPSDGCCIVASVALGSPYAAEIQALRRVRDHVVRSTEVGRAFFDALHREYYAFSVDVCRIMVRHPQARADVEGWLVRPLSHALHLLLACARGGPGLTAAVAAQVEGADRGEPTAQLEALLRAVMEGRVPQPLADELDPGTQEVLHLLALWLPHSPHVVWGIIEPLAIRLHVARHADDPARVTSVARERFEEWFGRMPTHYVREAVDPRPWSDAVARLLQTLIADAALRDELALGLGAAVGSTQGGASR